MKETKNLLMGVYVAGIVLALAIVCLYETEVVLPGLLATDKQSLRKWGFIRLLLLLLPLCADTLLYYLYMNTTFGYLGIILVLCLPFVYPSENRCEDEVRSE